MTRLDKVRLTQAVWACMNELSAKGRFTTREVSEMVMERYTEVVHEASMRLAMEAIAGISRRLMKKSAPRSSQQMPLFLPTELRGLQIPNAISLPTVEDGEPGYTWINIRHATLAELELHEQLLLENYQNIGASLDVIRTLRRAATEVMGERKDVPFIPELEAIAIAEDDAADAEEETEEGAMELVGATEN